MPDLTTATQTATQTVAPTVETATAPAVPTTTTEDAPAPTPTVSATTADLAWRAQQDKLLREERTKIKKQADDLLAQKKKIDDWNVEFEKNKKDPMGILEKMYGWKPDEYINYFLKGKQMSPEQESDLKYRTLQEKLDGIEQTQKQKDAETKIAQETAAAENVKKQYATAQNIVRQHLVDNKDQYELTTALDIDISDNLMQTIIQSYQNNPKLSDKERLEMASSQFEQMLYDNIKKLAKTKKFQELVVSLNQPLTKPNSVTHDKSKTKNDQAPAINTSKGINKREKEREKERLDKALDIFKSGTGNSFGEPTNSF